MGYLIGEILICLILAALIGAVVAWLLRGVRCRSRENELLGELKGTHSKLDTAEGELRRLEASFADLRNDFDLQAKTLEARNEKLSTVKASLSERNDRIAELESELAQLRDEKQVEISSLREHIGTLEPLQGQLDESQTERNRLQAELRAVEDSMQSRLQQLNAQLSSTTSKKDAEIERLRAELEQASQQLRTESAERDTTIKRLQHELQVIAQSKADEETRLNRRIEDLDRQLSGMEALRSTLRRREDDLDNWQSRFSALEREKGEEISALKSKIAANDDLAAQLAVSRAEVERCSRELSALRTTSEQNRRGFDKQRAASEARHRATGVLPAGQLFERPAEVDDLKKIWGIGPKLEKTLHRLGITTFAQIARFSADDIERVGQSLDFFPGRIVRDGWTAGAAKEHYKKYGERLDP